MQFLYSQVKKILPPLHYPIDEFINRPNFIYSNNNTNR